MLIASGAGRAPVEMSVIVRKAKAFHNLTNRPKDGKLAGILKTLAFPAGRKRRDPMFELMKTNRRLIIFLVVSNFLLFSGFYMWQTMFNNFAVEEIGVGASQIGWIQAFRELPGLFGFLVGVAALYLSEARVMALAGILLGVGIFMTGQSQAVPSLLIATFIMSVGFHFFYPANSAIILMATEKRQTPRILGQLQSLGAVAAVVSTGAVLLLVDRVGYRTLFMGAGALIVLIGLVLLPLGTFGNTLPVRRKIVLRKKYWLYYTLAFLMGSRRHIFTTFAAFLLVKEYGMPVHMTATLFLITSLINVYAMQMIGKMINRFGERAVLSFTFAVLTAIFLCYAYVTFLPLLYVLFVIDHVLFGFGMALSTYFQKIAVTPEEITSNVSVESAINHISAVILPVAGGAIWQIYGSKAPFLVGTGLVVISLLLTQFLRTPAEELPAVPAPVGGV
jgi:MFS family permease